LCISLSNNHSALLTKALKNPPQQQILLSNEEKIRPKAIMTKITKYNSPGPVEKGRGGYVK
jgi:hypothetical protein